LKTWIKIVVVCTILTFVAGAVAQSLSGTPVQRGRGKGENQLKSLAGSVLGSGDAPLANAIVYLKNTKTLTVRTFITEKDGKYRFNALSPNVDYEVYAEYNGKKSDTKTLSSFDNRADAYINLHVNTA
jgi:hypothetical protein